MAKQMAKVSSMTLVEGEAEKLRDILPLHVHEYNQVDLHLQKNS